MVCIALVAGEASGDLLGAPLIRTLKQSYPDAEFFGIAGPEMMAAGCQSLYPMEALSVMGFEALKHLPKLLKMRKQLFQQILQKKPDVFIGIDAPDFNLALERKLKEQGIKTVHYVSPSVWAWRQWRVKKISHSIDLMLTLFPFEVDFYREHNINAHFVGHPLADLIPLHPNKEQARQQLGMTTHNKLVALLPGSRMGELQRLSDLFINAASICAAEVPDVGFIVPFANDKTRQHFQSRLDELKPDLNIQLVSGQSRLVMQASDVVLLASGTAALEALLLKRPMVVSYKLSALTFWILKTFKILKVSLYSLPNLLAGKKIVEEYVQAEANPSNLGHALVRLLTDESNNAALIKTYEDIHLSMKQDASQQAALAITKLISQEA